MLRLTQSVAMVKPSAPSANPVVALGNYVFDSLKMDAFRISRGRLCEAKLTTWDAAGGDGANGALDVEERLKRLRRVWQYEPVAPDAPYYPDEPALEAVLRSYAGLPEGTSFTLPVGGLRGLAKLSALTSGGGFAALLTDKGHTSPALFPADGSDPVVTLHGSLSLVANLDAVGRWFQARQSGGGGAAAPVVVAHSEQSTAALDATFAAAGLGGNGAAAHAFSAAYCGFGVNEAFVLRDHVEDTASANGVDALGTGAVLALCRLSAYDQDLLWQFGGALRDGAAGPDAPGVRHALARVAANYAAYFDRSGEAREAYDAAAAALDPPAAKLLTAAAIAGAELVAGERARREAGSGGSAAAAAHPLGCDCCVPPTMGLFEMSALREARKKAGGARGAELGGTGAKVQTRQASLELPPEILNMGIADA